MGQAGGRSILDMLSFWCSCVQLVIWVLLKSNQGWISQRGSGTYIKNRKNILKVIRMHELTRRESVSREEKSSRVEA